MLTEKLQILMRIYKYFDLSFSLIGYYPFLFGLIQISIGLSVFRFIANQYKRRAIQLHLTIRNMRSPIRWAIEVILNYSPFLTIVVMSQMGTNPYEQSKLDF